VITVDKELVEMWKDSKGEAINVLFLTEHHAMKVYWEEWRYSSTQSLTSALYTGEWSASRPRRLTPSERAPEPTE
jgi:hypothetical protein